MSILFDPYRLGSVELRNRIVFAPMNTGYEENGMVTGRSLAFYERITRGGVGLIVLGDCSVQPAMTPTPGIYDNRFLPGLRQLVEKVHAQGGRIAAQLSQHEYDTVEIATIAKAQGREAAYKQVREDYQKFANRATLEQIHRIQDLYVSAALRAREAGFDMVQIQGDRLIGMFSSPVMNQRQDPYGGTLENRARFALEVVAKIRAAAPDLPIDYRLALIRGNPRTGGLTLVGKGGPTLEESQKFAPWLVKAGVNSFLVCQANHSDIRNSVPPAGAAPYGCFIDLAWIVKQACGVPVAAGGRIIRPAMAESVLQQGKADLVALGRALLCDPEWPIKAEEGRESEIRECIMCNRCVETYQAQKPLLCAVNGQTGGAVTMEITPANPPRQVVVVGGGPAGMEAARVAAVRGHSVTLIERSRSLGGQLRLATAAPYKEEMKRITSFLTREMPRLWVDVRLGTEATVDLLRKLSPDLVIVAAGAAPPQKVQGLEAEDTTSHFDAWEVLSGSAETGQNVVVVGGGMVGLDVAQVLALQGKVVTVIEMQERVGADVSPTVLPLILKNIQDAGIEILTNHRVVSLLSDGVVVEAGGGKRVIQANSIVKAAGIRQPQKILLQALQAAGIPFRAVGDCSGEKARQLSDAIHEGFRAGLEA